MPKLEVLSLVCIYTTYSAEYNIKSPEGNFVKYKCHGVNFIPGTLVLQEQNEYSITLLFMCTKSKWLKPLHKFVFNIHPTVKTVGYVYAIAPI